MYSLIQSQYTMSMGIPYQRPAANISPEALMETYFIEKGLKQLHFAQDLIIAYVNQVESYRNMRMLPLFIDNVIIYFDQVNDVLQGKNSQGLFLHLTKMARKVEKFFKFLDVCYIRCEHYLDEYQDNKKENKRVTSEMIFRYVRAKYFRETYEKVVKNYQCFFNYLQTSYLYRYFPTPSYSGHMVVVSSNTKNRNYRVR